MKTSNVSSASLNNFHSHPVRTYTAGERLLIDEDAEHEFKATHLTPKPVQKIIDLSYTYVNAFLNTSGGTLYCGVTDDGYVVGNLLNRDQRDHIRKSFDSLVLDSFWPCLDTRMASIHMIKVFPSPELLNAFHPSPDSPPRSITASSPPHSITTSSPTPSLHEPLLPQSPSRIGSPADDAASAPHIVVTPSPSPPLSASIPLPSFAEIETLPRGNKRAANKLKFDIDRIPSHLMGCLGPSLRSGRTEDAVRHYLRVLLASSPSHPSSSSSSPSSSSSSSSLSTSPFSHSPSPLSAYDHKMLQKDEGIYVVEFHVVRDESSHPVYLLAKNKMQAFIRRAGSITSMSMPMLLKRVGVSLGDHKPAPPSVLLPPSTPSSQVIQERAAEFAALLQTVQSEIALLNPNLPVVLNLYGLPGVGKATLSRRLSNALQGQWPDKHYTIDLRGNSEAPAKHLASLDAMRFLIRAYMPLSVMPANVSEVQGYYLSCFSGKRAILHLDNVSLAEQATSLIPESPTLVIVTSARRLTLHDQYHVISHQVKPLDTVDAACMLLRLTSSSPPTLLPIPSENSYSTLSSTPSSSSSSSSSSSTPTIIAPLPSISSLDPFEGLHAPAASSTTHFRTRSLSLNTRPTSEQPDRGSPSPRPLQFHPQDPGGEKSDATPSSPLPAATRSRSQPSLSCPAFAHELLMSSPLSWEQACEFASLGGNLPLALRCISSILKHGQPDALLKRLRESEGTALLQLESSGPISKCLEASIKHLSPSQSQLFKAVCIFPGRFSFEACRIILQLEDDEAFDLLGVLVDDNLLEYDNMAHTYFMHELIRMYGKSLPTPAEDQNQLLMRFITYYSNLLARMTSPNNNNNNNSNNNNNNNNNINNNNNNNGIVTSLPDEILRHALEELDEQLHNILAALVFSLSIPNAREMAMTILRAGHQLFTQRPTSRLAESYGKFLESMLPSFVLVHAASSAPSLTGTPSPHPTNPSLSSLTLTSTQVASTSSSNVLSHNCSSSRYAPFIVPISQLKQFLSDLALIILDYGAITERLGFEAEQTYLQLLNFPELDNFCIQSPDGSTMVDPSSALGELRQTIKSSALLVLGRLWFSQCRFQEAHQALQESLAIRESLFQPASLEVAEVLVPLARLLMTTWTTNISQTQEILNRALSIYQAVTNADSTELAVALELMGEMAMTMAQFPRAVGLLKRALSIYQRRSDPDKLDSTESHGPLNVNSASVQHNLGKCYAGMGRYKEADQFYKSALESRRHILGPGHPLVAHTLRNLAFLYFAMGESDRSEGMYNEAMGILRAVYGEKDHLEVAYVLNDLGLVYNHRTDYRKALSLFEQSLKIRERLLGKVHVDTAVALNNIGNAYRKLGNFTLAEQYYQEALGIRRKSYGDHHPEIARSLHNVAIVKLKTHQYEEALQLLLESKRIREASLGHRHPEMAACFNAIGDLYFQQHDFQQALREYAESLAINEHLFGSLESSSNPSLGILALKLGKTYAMLDQLDQAEAYFVASLQQAQTLYGTVSQMTRRRIHELETFYSCCAQNAASPEQSRVFLQKKLDIIEQYPSRRAQSRREKLLAQIAATFPTSTLLPSLSTLRNSTNNHLSNPTITPPINTQLQTIQKLETALKTSEEQLHFLQSTIEHLRHTQTRWQIAVIVLSICILFLFAQCPPKNIANFY